MAKEASFDVVSEINTEEVKNAIQLAEKELKNRFDFKGSTVEIKMDGNKLTIVGDDEFKLEQIKDVLSSKLIKRSVPTKISNSHRLNMHLAPKPVRLQN